MERRKPLPPVAAAPRSTNLGKKKAKAAAVGIGLPFRRGHRRRRLVVASRTSPGCEPRHADCPGRTSGFLVDRAGHGRGQGPGGSRSPRRCPDLRKSGKTSGQHRGCGHGGPSHCGIGKGGSAGDCGTTASRTGTGGSQVGRGPVIAPDGNREGGKPDLVRWQASLNLADQDRTRISRLVAGQVATAGGLDQAKSGWQCPKRRSPPHARPLSWQE